MQTPVELATILSNNVTVQTALLAELEQALSRLLPQATVAVSAVEAAALASGDLVLTTHHTFAQTISSTAATDLAHAVLVLGLKLNDSDDDAHSVVLLRSDTGLSLLAQQAYAAPQHGSLSVAGSEGNWSLLLTINSIACGLLTAYIGRSLYAEVKDLSTDTAIWTGYCKVLRGIVQAVA